MEKAGRNNRSIMEGFKREFDNGALIVNTKSQVLIRLENLHLKIHLSINIYEYNSTQEINDGFCSDERGVAWKNPGA